MTTPRAITAAMARERAERNAWCRRRGLPTRAEHEHEQRAAAERVVRAVRRWCYARHTGDLADLPPGVGRCACGHPAVEVDPVCAGLAAVTGAVHYLDAAMEAHALYRRATGGRSLCDDLLAQGDG